MIMTLTFEEAKVWSLMTPLPVVVNDDCFWFGLLMTKNMAMCLASSYFFKIGVTPEQKRQLWGRSVEQFRKIDGSLDLNFNIFDFNEDSHMRYLSSAIYGQLKNKSVQYTKEQFVKDFLL